MSLSSVEVGLHRLRRRNLERLCPFCFRESVVGGTCTSCGAERDAPSLPLEVAFESQSPTSLLHPGHMLGSQIDYDAVARSYGFSNRGMVLERKIQRQIAVPLLDGVRSDIGNALNGDATPELQDEAGRLAIKEVAEFLSAYPSLRTSKLARRALVANVLRRLRMLHPNLRMLTPLQGGDGYE